MPRSHAPATSQHATGVNLAQSARELWFDFAALTSPQGSELSHLHRAGITFSALAALYPLEVLDHVPKILELLRAHSDLARTFSDSTLESALSNLGFGITATRFYDLQPQVRERAHTLELIGSGLAETSILKAAIWWAYALTYLFDRALLPTYHLSGARSVADATCLLAAVVSASVAAGPQSA